jgi:predicted enzyme related to lactoylglutathione lyase
MSRPANVLHPIESKLPAVFIHVHDLHRAAEFYSQLLGLPYDPSADYGNGIYVIRMANGADLLLDANHAQHRQPNSHFAMHATCMFAAADIDAAHTLLQSQGIEIITEIYRDPNVAFFNFKDPDGNIQMICQSQSL